uniref:Putative ovule protein n=1 Tax=Solanum chacoense TaxID=4108 RepID=A0A0V0GR22_SOLCH
MTQETPNHLKISSHNLVANLQCIKIRSMFSSRLLTKEISTQANNISYPKILHRKNYPTRRSTPSSAP